MLHPASFRKHAYYITFSEDCKQNERVLKSLLSASSTSRRYQVAPQRPIIPNYAFRRQCAISKTRPNKSASSPTGSASQMSSSFPHGSKNTLESPRASSASNTLPPCRDTPPDTTVDLGGRNGFERLYLDIIICRIHHFFTPDSFLGNVSSEIGDE